MTNTEYLLICLMEEAAEVQQIAAKCLRFGLDNHHPDHPEVTNAEDLQRELTDLDAVKYMLADTGAISIGSPWGLSQKISKVRRYMQVSVECGMLDAGQAGEERR